ncbi:MAG: PepSY-like domain-containing protein [Bacteroidota bacterium]
MYKIFFVLTFIFTMNINVLMAQYEKVETAKVPQTIVTAFKEKYPKATDEAWTKDRKKNYTVKFKMGKYKCFSNYDKDAKWNGASITYTFDELPEIIKDAFKKSEYATWKIQDITKSENDYENVFVFIVKNKEQKLISFKEDGTLKKQ